MHILSNWFIQALIIAVIASTVLNGCPFLPFFRDIKPRRIEARWVGYVGLTSAFGLWLILGLNRPAWQAVIAWVVIVVFTLIPNTLIHMRNRDTDGLSLLLTLEGKMLLERYLQRVAPEDPALRDRFMAEQIRETAEERWMDAIAPWAGMLNEFDIVFACLVQAIKSDPDRKQWLLTVLADLIEMRRDIVRARENTQLWYGMFFPEYAR